MATRTVLIDDLDGGEANVTIAFVVNGNSYSLDLSDENAKKFHAALAPYIEAASKRASTRMSIIEGQLAGVEQRQAIREWAKKKGYDISERGRIPSEIVEAYEQKHKK